RVLEGAPETMGAQISIFAAALDSPAPNKISLTGQYRGPPGKFQAILGDALTDAEHKAIEPLAYWQAQEFFEIKATPNRYQETSLFADALSDALIEEAFRLSRTLPDKVAKARLTFFLTG